jgi:Na+/H+-dicarboxylate symporter
MQTAIAAAEPRGKVPFYRHLYVQVLAAIAAGILLGHFYPELGASLKPLGDAFIKLVKMVIAPVIFLTVATGIAGMSDLQKVWSCRTSSSPVPACTSTRRRSTRRKWRPSLRRRMTRASSASC